MRHKTNQIAYSAQLSLWEAQNSGLEEGDSPIRAHIVLDEFSSESGAKRLFDLGTGRSISTVDGRFVIQDASGRELASVKIQIRGSVAFSPGEGSNTQGRQARSDFEKRLLEEIESLK